MTDSNLQLSILIITFNSEKYISNCVDSILLQNPTPINYEVVIVDNSSNDNTSSVVKSKSYSIRYFQNTSNLGFAKAVNESIKYLNGKYILLINPDVVLKKDFFQKLYSLLNERNDLDILGVKLLDEKGKIQPSSWKNVTYFTVMAEMLLPYQLSKKMVTVSPSTFSEVENVSGACMLIRRDVFEKLSGFDENYFLYYEEIDFCKRAKSNGYKIFYSPNLEVIHSGLHSSEDNKELFFYNLYRNKLYFIRKHFSKIFYQISYIIVIIGIFLRILVSFAGGLVSLNKNLIRISQTLILVLIKITRNNA